MNTCENCGNQVPEEKAFCPNCGAAMSAERQRPADNVSEELGPTMYGYDAVPDKILPTPPLVPDLPPLPTKAEAPKQPPLPAKAAPGAATGAVPSATPKPASGVTRQRPPASAVNAPKSKPAAVPDDDGNRTPYLILGASAALFALAVLAVIILYFMGKL